MTREEYKAEAVKHFEALLDEQLARCDKMKENPVKKDYTKLDKIKIGILGGDGIGPIILKEALSVLRYLLKDELESGKVEVEIVHGLKIENRLRLNKSIPEEVREHLHQCDVILKGPTTTPKGGVMESANVALRRELDLYANVRPIKVPELGIDWTFFRENTEGEYVLGSKGYEIPGDLAVDFKVTTDLGTERIARAAFDYARANGKKNVAIVTKANIMKKTDGKFSEICHRIAEEYPEIETEDWYIDIMTANLINPDIRSKFEVVLLPNLYGDIITDEAAQIQGGVGTAGSANLGDEFCMFEAIHGSAPRLMEEGLGEYASPASILKAEEMMLRYIGYTAEADRLEAALQESLKDMSKVPNGTKEGPTAAQFTELILSNLK